nr:MAG TPA: hypothetical protein [Caudoviricetes sp.]
MPRCRNSGAARSLLWSLSAEGNRDSRFRGRVRPFDGLLHAAQLHSQVHPIPLSLKVGPHQLLRLGPDLSGRVYSTTIVLSCKQNTTKRGWIP